VTGHIFAGVSKHGPGIYLGQYLATCKHRMQAMPSPSSGMLCGTLVAIVLVLRQDCYCLSALYTVRVAVSISLAWSGCCYNRFLLFSLPAYSAKNEHGLAETALNACALRCSLA
jgi:hypothetical protein